MKSGHIGGVAVDVLAIEPPEDTNLLVDSPNCIATPHMACTPKEPRARLMDITVMNPEVFLAGNAKSRVLGR